MILFDTLLGLFSSIKYVNIFDSNFISISCGLILVGCVLGIALYKITNRKNYRSGEEYGSADYGDINKLKKELTDEESSNNMICSKNIDSNTSKAIKLEAAKRVLSGQFERQEINIENDNIH